VHDRRAPHLWWSRVPYLDPAVGDHKIIWEINRHQYWLPLVRALWLTGDARYGRAITDALESWLAANPPLTGINWASMLEIGLRSMSWTWGLHALLAHEAHEVSHEEHEVTSHEEHEEHDGSRLGDLRDLRGNKRSRLRDLRVLRGKSSSCASWLVDMLIGLDRQLRHVEHNLSYYFSPNTHLTGEALALYVVGTAVPELAASARWAATGRRILLAEIDRQILPDGGHVERSTHYQRYTLDFYLLALLTARRSEDTDAAAVFAEAVSRLATFTRALANDRGRLPLIGDDDGGMLWPMTGRDCNDVRDSLALAAVALSRPELAVDGVPEEVFWIGGLDAMEQAPAIERAPTDREPSSQTFPDTGYVVMRNGAGGHAVLDAGLHGYMNGGHAHADALSVAMTLGGRPFLVDPGTSTYTTDGPLRDRMRSSMNHNTVVLDGRPQATPSGPFHWRTRADARLHAARHNAAFDWVEASHDGYRPLRHRRTIFRHGTEGWLIVDETLGTGRHTATTHWHFDPAWMLTSDAPGRLRATHLDGDMAWLLHDVSGIWLVHGDEDSGLGWFAPVYGTLLPTWTARLTRRGVAPFASVCWIGHASASIRRRPTLERVATTADPAGAAIAARVSAVDRAAVFMLRPGEAPLRDTRGCGVLDYQTNARALHYETDGDRLTAMDVVDASHALALREGWISLAASEAVRDLHLSIDDSEVLTVYASQPPSQLRIQGGSVTRLRGILLNGREAPNVTAGRRDMRLLYGGDWGTAVPSIGSRDHTFTPLVLPA
jgi:hypothetical protein